jgi:predicted nucleic acid-binding protein
VIVVDSNIVIDLIGRDPLWFDWSSAKILEAVGTGAVAISAVSVGEIAPRIETLAALEAELSALTISIEALTGEAAFIAGKAFATYRARRIPGQSKTILADFLIGGHAVSLDAHLLTRDPRFYRSYFPDLTLITPESHP